MKILMIAVTNFDLYYVSSITHLLKKKYKSLDVQLLLRYTFKNSLTPELRNLYSKVHLFEVPTLTFYPRSKSKIKALINFFNFYHPLQFRGWIKRILINVNVVCVCAFREFFINILCRVAPSRIRLIALRIGNEIYEKRIKYVRRPFVSSLLNIKNFIFGYSTIDYKWRADSKEDLLVKDFKKNPYHRIISITDHDFGNNGVNYRLPPPFIAIKELYDVADRLPIILVAGEKTPLYKDWNEIDQKTYENFLDYLRKNFNNDFKLYFKPKKGKTDLRQFNLEGFHVISPNICLEEFCVRNNIQKVISIMSSACRIGTYFGIPSYLIYPLFNFPPLFRSVIENFFDDMRSIKRISKLEDLREEPWFFEKKYDVDHLVDLYSKAIMF